MDFTDNVVLKEHYTFLVADEDGQVSGGERGLYNRDTRQLSRYEWSWRVGDRRLRPLVVASPRPDTLQAHHALIAGPSQRAAVARTVTLMATGLRDELELSNTSLETLTLDIDLLLAADFVDLFETRGWAPQQRQPATVALGDAAVSFSHVAIDGVKHTCALSFGGEAPSLGRLEVGARASWSVTLAPGEVRGLSATVRIENPLDRPPTDPMTYEQWRASFASLWSGTGGGHHASLERAVDDLRGLLLFTPEGPVPAAGIPWFVAAFGRDALLTSYFLLPYRPDVAASTLAYLARWQARMTDDERAAQPGKIMHELRFGELTRTGLTPHSPYYGTVDATPLFVVLLAAYVEQTGDHSLLTTLRPAWEAALAWLIEHGDPDGDGFLEFETDPGGTGHLSVQSWKDSHDSMSHASGALARGPLAVSEVQGYAYAAYAAAGRWYEALGEPIRAREWTERAERLFTAFDEAFWLDDLQTYAMALDGGKQPLAVLNSDAGHLLWCGIVPPSRAAPLVATLFSPRSWSGWGLRTLGAGEARYNPVSYHNGSVWPHDTALFAAGLVRYGFAAEAAFVRSTLFELAARQGDLRLPELVGGYPRDGRPPVPYPVACRPQAWDAAALVYLASLGLDGAEVPRPKESGRSSRDL